MRTKGVGPQGLGVANVSPLKQTKKQQSIMQNEDGSAYTGQSESKFGHVEPNTSKGGGVKLSNYKDRPKQTGAVEPVIDLTDILTGGPAGGLAKKAVVGGLVKSGFVNTVKKGVSRLFGNSKNKKALDAFKKASPKDPTKTTRLSSYNNKPSNLRADGFGGTTSVGSRRNYNNSGSN